MKNKVTHSQDKTMEYRTRNGRNDGTSILIIFKSKYIKTVLNVFKNLFLNIT